MPKNDSTEAETYRKMFLAAVEENGELKKQVAQEVKEKYAAYRRIAELTGSSPEAIKEDME